MALDKKINILPLMLKQATPPIFIYRIQYLDCQNCMIGNTLNEDLCKSVFERIERNIQEYSLDTSGSYSSLGTSVSYRFFIGYKPFSAFFCRQVMA